MRKNYNKYDDDIYDDDDYYDEEDEYYEEEEEDNYQYNKNKKPSKPQPSKPQQPSKLQQQPKSQPSNPKQAQPQSTPSEPPKKKAKENKELSPSELNAIKYPPISYKQISNSTSEKTDISVVVIGHVDSGKSTLMGHLLYDLGCIDKKVLQSCKKNYKKTGTSQFHYAWATDEGTDERERGVTVEVAYKTFTTKTKNVNAMDAPGHRDFIPSMIAGTSAADAAILVIDSGQNAFDHGFFKGGQTKEHAILAKTLGVKQIIVCINKLELFNWNKERFDYIKIQVHSFLTSIGFKDEDIFCIPISGLTGDNITHPITASTGSWYEDKTLIDLIDGLEAPIRVNDAPVRFVISDASFGAVNDYQGYVVFGKLECGVIDTKTEYEIQPTGLKVKIRSIAVNKEKVNYVLTGQTAELLLNLDKNSNEEISSGFVLSSVEYGVPVVKAFQAQVKTLDIKCPVSVGQKMFLHLQGQKVQVKVRKILKIYNDDNSTVKNNSIFIPKNFNANVIVDCEEKICAELYGNIKQLGRIALRGEGETIAIGFIMEFVA